MDAVFEQLLQVSLSGSIVVLAVLILRLALRKAPRRAVCLLWMLAVLRLLVPFQIESSWSLQPTPPEFSPPAVQEGYFDSGADPTPVPPEFLEDAVEYPLQPIPTPEKQTGPMEVLGWLWLVGVGVLAIHGAVSYLQLKRRVRDAVILEEGVWISPGLDTAFVLGFFRPQIYLPVLTREEQELVLLHERCHIRRFDHWWKLLAYAAVSLHWFNPLAWVTYVLLCRDMELACDQETVKGMDNVTRKAYSAALLRCAVKRSGIAACPVAFGEISVKERIKMVLNYKKPGFWVTVFALIAAIAVGFFLLTSPKELTDLEKCEQGLQQWQDMDAYQFRVHQSESGDEALVDFYLIEYWSSCGEHLMKFSYAEDLGDWQHWKDGKAYIYEFGSLDAEWENSGWHSGDFQETAVIPWVLRLNWDKLTVHNCESTDEGKTVLLTVDYPVLGSGTMTFQFDDDGKLSMVSRTFTVAGSSLFTAITELVETDRAEIEKDLENLGVQPELVQLYRELERIQGMEHIHLITNIQDGTGNPDYDASRQEFIRCGNNYYRNYENHGSYGSWVVTALKFGGVIQVRQYSDDGAAPNMDWKQDDSREYDNVMLLTGNWTELEVSDIRQDEDGSTVITLQGDLAKSSNGVATYYSMTFDFCLSPDGRLVSLTYSDYSKNYIDNPRTEGVFEGPYMAITYILDTPAEELQERIQAVRDEIVNKQPRA